MLQQTPVADITCTKKPFSYKTFISNPVLVVKFEQNQCIKWKKS